MLPDKQIIVQLKLKALPHYYLFHFHPAMLFKICVMHGMRETLVKRLPPLPWFLSRSQENGSKKRQTYSGNEIARLSMNI